MWAAAFRVSPSPLPGLTRWETRSMTSSDARNLAFELWKLLRAGERFRDLRRRYNITRSLRDGTAAALSHRAGRHQRAVRLGGTLNRARIVLGERIRICRQKVNGLAAGPWRTDARRRLAPALTDLTDAIQRTFEVHPESAAGPTHAEILGAVARHETAIRECGLFLSDVAAEVREAAEHGTARRTQTPTDTAKTDTDWRDVQRRLMELYKRGDPYISIGNLAKRLGCAKATIQKAIKDSTKLKYWQARHTKAKGSEQ